MAVFSQKNSQRLLQVFNVEALTVVPSEGVKAITLREFMERDLADYDGPFVGFSALDILREDLVTKGTSFYPIERIFREHGQTEALYQTLDNLSIELMRHLSEQGEQTSTPLRQWVEARALYMALPSVLEDRVCDNLVAILPIGQLNRFISKKSFRFLYGAKPKFPLPVQLATQGFLTLEDLPGLKVDMNTSWVVALEEVALFNPVIRADKPLFLELREVLRRAGKERELQATRLALARELISTQEKIRSRGLLVTDSQPYLPVARALAAEYWLAQSELEDLIAFCPHNDFNHFLETGDAVRVYRVLEEGDVIPARSVGPEISMAQMVKEGLPEGYGETVFTFPLILYFMHNQPVMYHHSLSELFWKIGETSTLARSLWLASYDLMNGLCGPMPGTQTILDSSIDTALRACVLYSLSNPWTWRQGRWRVYLEGCYKTLVTALRRAAAELEQPLSIYYRALICWYDSFSDENPERRLREMLDLLRGFERRIRDRQPPGVDLRSFLTQSRQFIEISEALLRLPYANLLIESKSGQSNVNFRRISVMDGLRKAAYFSEPLPLVSSFFKAAWEFLLGARYKRQQLTSREREIDRLIEQLSQLRKDLRREQQHLFAPAHEQKVLKYAFQQEINHIESLTLELETSAKLSITLRNPWVDLHRTVDLTLDVSNVGRVVAEGVEIVLDLGGGIQLLDESAVREVTLLGAGEAKQVHYRVRVVRQDAELRVEYNFRDRRGQDHKDNYSNRLNVRNLDEEPFQVKVNHYQFGRPIQEPTEFYGRRNELENILSQLMAGGKQNLLLRGPRRMGKTSLLYMLQRVLTEPATRRFFNLPPIWDQQLDRVHPVFMSLHSFDLVEGIVAVNQFFRTLLERIAIVLNYPVDDLAWTLASYEQRVKEVGAVNAALEEVGRMLDVYPNERICVLLDEYDEVYRPETGSLDRHLREFVSAEQRLTWIIASTLALFREVKTISSPWFNVFSILELGRLAEEAAVSLVEIPCKDEKVFWRSDAVLTLLTETGRHPAFTQLFCARVIAHLNRIHTNYVLEEIILTVADEIVNEQETATSHFEFYWLDTGGIGRLILLLLDESETPLTRKDLQTRVRNRLAFRFGSLPKQRVPDQSGDPIEWQEREFKQGIDFVEKIVNAITLDEQRRYVFTVPLFRRWLRRRRLTQVTLADETFDTIAQEMEQGGITLR